MFFATDSQILNHFLILIPSEFNTLTEFVNNFWQKKRTIKIQTVLITEIPHEGWQRKSHAKRRGLERTTWPEVFTEGHAQKKPLTKMR